MKARRMHDHCVIGVHVTHSIGRSWFPGEKLAVEHAKELLGEQRNQVLLVVKVVKVVERATPPVQVRKLKAGDL